MTINRIEMRGRRGRMQVWQAAPWERFEARGVIATAIALAALAASATAGGAVASGAMQSHAAGESAKTQAQASSDATKQQLEYEREALAAETKANEESLAYTKQQAGQSRADAETTRQGDYEQWAAREGRLSTIGGMLGLPGRQTPAYRPLGPEQGAPAPGAPGAPAAGASGAPGDIMAALTQNYQKLGVSPTGPGTGPTDIAYMAGKIQETGGMTPNNVSYWFGPQGRIAQELAKANGGASAAAPAAAPAPYGSIAGMSGGAPPPLTAAYQAPTIPMPGSIRQMSRAA